jgi:site-specific recombinase XerD
VYEQSLRQLTEFLVANRMPTLVADIERDHVEEWVGNLAATRAKSTAAKRHTSVSLFFKWCIDDGAITVSPMEKVRPPKVPDTPVPLVTEDDLTKLRKACEGTAPFDLRDMAIIRLLFDSGLRRSELAGLSVDDIDLDHYEVVVLGKGERPRIVPFGVKTGKALDNYLRKGRTKHPLARKTRAAFLGTRGPVTGAGVAQILKKRCTQAGIETINPHRLRHCFADAWLRDGGSEGDLMRLAGWKTRQMVDRYASSNAAGRARQSYQSKPSFGDRL